jgi:hypothetical protein
MPYPRQCSSQLSFFLFIRLPPLSTLLLLLLLVVPSRNCLPISRTIATTTPSCTTTTASRLSGPPLIPPPLQRVATSLQVATVTLLLLLLPGRSMRRHRNLRCTRLIGLVLTPALLQRRCQQHIFLLVLINDHHLQTMTTR